MKHANLQYFLEMGMGGERFEGFEKIYDLKDLRWEGTVWYF